MIKKLSIMVIIWGIILVFASNALAAREAVKNYSSYKRDGNTVLFQCEGSHKVRIMVCKPDIVRVEFDPKGNFHLNTFNNSESWNMNKIDLASFMMKNDWAAVSFSDSDEGNYIKLQTNKLTVRIYKAPFRVQFWNADNSTLINKDDDAKGMECNTGGSGAPCDLYIQKAKSSTEHFFGFGNPNRMDRYPCDYTGLKEGQNPTGTPYANGHDGEHYAAPFFYSTDGYGIFAIFDDSFNSGWQMPRRNTQSESEWDMGASSSSKYSIRYWKTSLNDYRQYLIYYFMQGPSWREVIKCYNDITGKPAIFRKWAYGVHANNFPSAPTAYNWEIFVTKFREGKFPLDVMHVDNDYSWGTKNNTTIPQYTWFYNAGASYWNGAINKNGDDFIKWCHDQGVKFGANLHDELVNPEDHDATQTYVDHGFDVYWRDMTGNAGSFRDAMISYNNFKDANDGDGTLAFVRHGWQMWASHAYGFYHAGDASGHKALIKGQLASGLAGYTTTQVDLGIGKYGVVGYALMVPVFYHPYGKGDNGARSDARIYLHDNETQNLYRKWMGFHYEMLPYLFSCAGISSNEGVPIWRHMVIEDPKNTATYNKDDQAYVGDWLLVAPYFPTIPGHSNNKRSVWLPKGTWYDWFTGEKHTGEKTITYDVSGYKLPLFVKAGAIIPMGPAMQHVGEVPENPITLRIYPSGSTEFTLWEDATPVKTTFSCDHTASASTIKIPPFDKSRYSDSSRKYRLELYALSDPKYVARGSTKLTKYSSESELDAQTEGWYYDSGEKLCHVKPNGNAKNGFKVVISYDGTAILNDLSVTLSPKIAFFQGGTGLKITIPERGQYGIKIINVLGKSVAQHFGNKPGDYTLSLANLAAGIYMCKVRTQSKVVVKKFIKAF